MSRVYEMTAGAVIDAEGRTVVNGVVTIYNAETGGAAIAPGTIRQSDGTAWPLEGVKTDGNGKVKLQWPDSAGDEPAKLWVDTSRGRWPLEPADLSSRVADLEINGVGSGGAAPQNERGDYTTAQADDANFAIGDVFSWQGGRHAVFEPFVGGATPDLSKTIFLGADASAIQISVAEDEDANTATFWYALPSGMYATQTLVRVDTPGGTVGGVFDPADITNEWNRLTMPTTKMASWAATAGSIPLTHSNSLNGASTGYNAGAFGGKGGFVLENDERYADLAADRSLDPGDGWGCAYVVIENFGPLATTDGADMAVLSLYPAGFGGGTATVQVRFVMHDSGSVKTYSWVVRMAGEADMVVAAGTLPGLNASFQRVANPTSVALLLKGEASFLAVNGLQKGATLPLTGKSARIFDLRPDGPTGPERGIEAIWSAGWTTQGLPNSAAAQAWVADRLAAAQA